MENSVREERLRCVEICRRRAELWRRAAATAPTQEVLVEARSRANEASYLADLLETGQDITAAV